MYQGFRQPASSLCARASLHAYLCAMLETKSQIDHANVIDDLARNIEVFRSMLDGLSREEVQWKPQPDKWSLLEIVCHLYDEEREDFGARLKHVVATPLEDLPPSDPIGWFNTRNYASEDYQQSLNRFLEERQRTVAWLRTINSSDWKNAYIHKKYGPLSAEFFLVNWLAHDMLHIRQILRTRYLYLAETTKTDLRYAGEW